MSAAKLRQSGAAIEDIDYRAPRQLDRDLFRRLAEGALRASPRSKQSTGLFRPGKP